MIVLGIDPGHEGAAVLLVDGKVVYAWTWKRYGEKKPARYYLSIGALESMVGAPPLGATLTMGQIGGTIAYACDFGSYHGQLDMLAVEGLFVGKDPPAALTLAELAGKVMGPLEDAARHIHRPQARQWRPRVLGLPPTASSVLSVRTASLVLNVRRGLLPRWLALPDGMRYNEHLLEAGCIARDGDIELKQMSRTKR